MCTSKCRTESLLLKYHLQFTLKSIFIYNTHGCKFSYYHFSSGQMFVVFKIEKQVKTENMIKSKANCLVNFIICLLLPHVFLYSFYIDVDYFIGWHKLVYKLNLQSISCVIILVTISSYLYMTSCYTLFEIIKRLYTITNCIALKLC
jgi:hypothetical protein